MNFQSRRVSSREVKAPEGAETAYAGSRSGIIAELAVIAGTDPEEFIGRLDWRVGKDLSVIEKIDTRTGVASRFHALPWLEAWISSRGDGRSTDLRVVSGWIEDEPVVAIPLSVAHTGYMRIARPLAQDVNDYNQPVFHRELVDVAEGQFAAALWSWVGKLLGDIDCLSLRKLTVAPECKMGQCQYSPEAHGAHSTEFQGKWTEIEDGYFGKSTRRSLSRKHKKLAAFGAVDIRRLDTPAERSAAIEKLSEWKRSQLDEYGMANRFSHKRFRDFLRGVAAIDQPETYSLYAIFAGEEMLAVTLMLCDESRWFLYQTAYTAEEPGHFSPGLVLLREIMRQASEAGASVFDFGMGDEPYKDKFCETHMTLYRAEIPYTLRGHLRAAVAAAESALRRMVKKNPRIRRIATTILRLPVRMGLWGGN